MKLKLSFLIITLISQPAYAWNFTGKWQGTGTLELPTKELGSCNNIELVVSHNEQANWTGLWIMSGFQQCQFPTHFPGSTMFEIKNKVIYYDKIAVGSATERGFDILFKDNFFKELIHFEFRENTSVSFKRSITYPWTLDSYKLEAILNKK